MKRNLRRLVIAHRQLIGCEATTLESMLWTTRGMRRYLAEWHNAIACSHRELELLLGLFDEGTQIRFSHESDGKSEPVEMTAECFPVIRPNARELRLAIKWHRQELRDRFAVISDAVERIVDWWDSQEHSNIQFNMAWDGTAIVISPIHFCGHEEQAMKVEETDDLLVSLCKLYGIKRKRRRPAGTLLAIEVDTDVQIPPQHLVVADGELNAFLANRKSVRLAWKAGSANSVVAERSETTGWKNWSFIPLADGLHELRILGPPQLDTGEWLLNGHATTRRSCRKWPELFVFRLPHGSIAGMPVTLSYRYGQILPDRVSLFPNPVECFSVCRTARGWVWSYDALPAGTGTVNNPVAGHQSIARVHHVSPLRPTRPAESNKSMFARTRWRLTKCLRRVRDIRTALQAEFELNHNEVACRQANWLTDNARIPRFCAGIKVELHPDNSSNADLHELATHARRFLERQLPNGTDFCLSICPQPRGDI
jgi:hypothetical protein